MSILKYDIPLKVADEMRNLLSTRLHRLQISKDQTKKNTWDVNLLGYSHQLGAIYYGGQEKKVEVSHCCAYVQLRFDRTNLRHTGLYDSVDAMIINRDDTTEFIRFKMFDMDDTIEVIKQLQMFIN
jgi:hypothetical protein